MSMAESVTDQTFLHFTDETELLGFLLGADPDTVAPGESPRFLYRGGPIDEMPALEQADVDTSVRRVEQALQSSDGGTEVLKRWAAMKPVDRRLHCCGLGSLYGLSAGCRIFTCDPYVALEEAAYAVDDAADFVLQRLRMSDFYTANYRRNEPLHLADLRRITPDVATRPRKHQAVACCGRGSLQEMLADTGGYHILRLEQSPRPRTSEATPDNDPMAKALGL